MKSNKEIERKWLINGFPCDTVPFTEGTIRQAYISTDPEVRVREAAFNGKPVARFLTIKSNGSMTRDEVEVRISKEQYDILLTMANGEPIVKQMKKYELSDGRVLECSEVDPDKGKGISFMYAEIEFDDEESANNFVDLPLFVKDVTSDPFYKMKNYWVRTRVNLDGINEPNKEADNIEDTANDIPDGLNDCLNKMGPFGEFIKDQIKDGNMKVVNRQSFDPSHFFDDMDPKDIAKFIATQAGMIHEHLDDFGFNEAQLAQIEGIVHDEAERLFSALKPSQTFFTWPHPIEGEECIAHGIGKLKTSMTKKKVKKLIKKMIEKYLDEFLKSKKLKKKIRNIVFKQIRDQLLDLKVRVNDIEEHMEDIDEMLDDADQCKCENCDSCGKAENTEDEDDDD